MNSEIDALVHKILRKFQIPGIALSIVSEGKIVSARGYGLRDQERKLPVTENSLFAIASCTKAFTSLVLGQLVDEGIVSWNDPVSKHIPEFRLQEAHASLHTSIKQLLTHQSGLPRHDFLWYSQPEISRQELLERLHYLAPATELGQRCHYNNLTFMVAGMVIERVTKSSWEENVQKRIFAPLGMKNSNFSWKVSAQKADFSLPYSAKEDKTEPVPFRDLYLVAPAAAINSSANDMAQWLLLQLSNGVFKGKKLVKKETLREMHTLQAASSSFPETSSYSLGYGLGWMVGSFRGHYHIFHEGGIDGFISHVSLLPQAKMGITLLSNKSLEQPYAAISHLAELVLDTLLGNSVKSTIYLPPSTTRRTAPQKMEEPVPAEYLGLYHHPAYGTMRITAEGALYNQLSFPLFYREKECFFGSPREATFDLETFLSFSFGREPTGEISSLQVPLEPFAQPVHFQRLFLQHNLPQFEGLFTSPSLAMRIVLRGNYLRALVSGSSSFSDGQPTYTLVPKKDRSFSLQEFPGGGLEFIQEEGEIRALLFSSPFEEVRMRKEGHTRGQ